MIIETFAHKMQKKLRLTRQGDNVRIEIIPIFDAPPLHAPLSLLDCYAAANAENLANPGIATVGIDLFSHPDFLRLVSPKEPAP